MPQLQITIDDDLDRTIRAEARRERLTLSSYARKLLVAALRETGVVIKEAEELPLLRKTEMN